MPHRLYIIEGITGSGKNTLSQALLEVLHPDTHPVYYYPEEAIAFSYNHVYWPGIIPLRLGLLEAALDFVEEEQKRLPGVAFVFNRFHLSLAATLMNEQQSPDVYERYQQILKRLRQMDVLVLLLKLSRHRLDSVLHPERQNQELVWKLFLERRVKDTAYSTPQEHFANQQRKFEHLARAQGLPYQTGSLATLLGFIGGLETTL